MKPRSHIGPGLGVVAILFALIFTAPSLPVFAESLLPVKIFYYNPNTTAAVGVLDDANNHYTLKGYGAGYFSPWTHVVSNGSDLFYYNATTGSGALGYIDSIGNHHTTVGIPAGSFSTGWTHIVFHKGYLFFYNRNTGSAAIGQMSPGGFHQFAGYGPGSFSTGWTIVASARNGLFFYNASNGAGAVWDWDYTLAGPPAGFQSITGVRFKQLSSFQPGSFTTGWTHIVQTSDAVLFYRSADGLQVMVDVYANGDVFTRDLSVKTLRASWTHVVAVQDRVLFYDNRNGDAAVGEIQAYNRAIPAWLVGTLSIKRDLPGVFSPGWSNIVVTADPPVIH